MADAFIQRNPCCIEGVNVYQFMHVNFAGSRTHDLVIASTTFELQESVTSTKSKLVKKKKIYILYIHTHLKYCLYSNIYIVQKTNV